MDLLKITQHAVVHFPDYRWRLKCTKNGQEEMEYVHKASNCIQTDSLRRRRTQQENEKSPKARVREADGVIDTQRMWTHRPHKDAGAAFWGFFPPWDQVSKQCVYRHCIYRIHVDDQPKRCKTCAFTHRSVSMWMAPELSLSIPHFFLLLRASGDISLHYFGGKQTGSFNFTRSRHRHSLRERARLSGNDGAFKGTPSQLGTLNACLLRGNCVTELLWLTHVFGFTKAALLLCT